MKLCLIFEGKQGESKGNRKLILKIKPNWL